MSGIIPRTSVAIAESKAYGYNGTSWQAVTLGTTTRTFVAIEYEHYKVHEGDSFTAGEVVELSISGTRTIIINTPDSSKYAHVLFQSISTAEANATMYENVTTTSDGTSMDALNRNRNSATTPTVTVFHSPSDLDTTGAIKLCARRWGTGKDFGAEYRAENEFVFKKNTKYAVVIENNSNKAENITWWVNWYEHVDFEA